MAEAALARRSTAAKALLAAALALPAAALTAWDEVLLGGPIIFLVETLGFAVGFAVFTVFWATLGVATLGLADMVWPRIGPGVRMAWSRSSTWWSWRWRATATLRRHASLPATCLGIFSVSAGLGVFVAMFGGRTHGFLQDHWESVAIGGLVVLGMLVVVVGVNLLRTRVESWAKRIAHVAKPHLRPVVAVLGMVYLGPILGWPLFRLLGYTRRTVYVLTLVGAPIFSAIWVPYYGLGIWALVRAAIT